MMRFEKYFQPKSVKECPALLKEYGADAKVLAGGTDLVPRLKNGQLHPVAVIGLMDIPGIDAIDVTDEGLTLGTLANLRKISLDQRLEKDYKVIMEACGHVSSMQVRNIATIGGNACNASPSADAIHGLLLYDAVATIASEDSMREVPLHEFFKGPGKTVLGTGDLLLRFFVPAPKAHTGASYQKYAIRGDSDISIVGAGARLTLDSDGAVAEARISLASVAPTPLRMFEAENMLVGSKLDAEGIEKAAEICSNQVSPITDQRATREYRIEMVRVWVRHALEQALERAKI